MLQNTQSLDINVLNKITSDEYIKYFKNNRDFNSFKNLMINLNESIESINNNEQIVTELKSNMSNIMIWVNNYSAALENKHIVNYLKNIINLLNLIQNTPVEEKDINEVTEQVNESVTEQVNESVIIDGAEITLTAEEIEENKKWQAEEDETNRLLAIEEAERQKLQSVTEQVNDSSNTILNGPFNNETIDQTNLTESNDVSNNQKKKNRNKKMIKINYN